MGPQFVGGPRVGHGAFVLATVLRFVAFLIIVAAIVYLVWAFLQTRSRVPRYAAPSTFHRSPALDELDLRYARGEVTRDEYLQRRADINALAQGPPLPPLPPPPPPAAPPPPGTA